MLTIKGSLHRVRWLVRKSILDVAMWLALIIKPKQASGLVGLTWSDLANRI